MNSISIQRNHDKFKLGYVYAFLAINNGYLKIGYTTNQLPDRCRQVSQSSGMPFLIQSAFFFRNPQKIEKIVHKILEPCHIQNEYYLLSSSEFETIIKHNFKPIDEFKYRMRQADEYQYLLDRLKNRCA